VPATTVPGAPSHTTVLRPRDVDDLAEIVAQATASSQPLRIAGAATWLEAGRATPPESHRLDLSALAGIVEYVPGDLTLTALAGTPLSTIAAATAANGQWLSLDPFGSPHGTLGATLATASTGPLAATLGQPRDVALGIEFVSGEGARIRGGGRVVKNVAGFDLVRLQVGAWGSLGVIAEATVRLRGRPEVERTLALRVPGPHALSTIAARVREQRATPLAAELLNAPLASRLGLGEDDIMLLRLAGNEDAVTAQVTTYTAFGDHAEVPGQVWATLAGIEPASATVFRLAGLPAAIPATWQRASTLPALPDDALLHASLGRGSVRVITTAPALLALDLVARARQAGRCLVERTTPDGRHALPAVASDSLSHRLRAAFDPRGILNPGILGHRT
jgi:glycolate oxidase FAD binding subunit